jgi:hypothetical protein
MHTSAYVCIRQHTSAYVSVGAVALAGERESIRLHTSAYVSIRQRTSAYVSVRHSIRQHTSAYAGGWKWSGLREVQREKERETERRRETEREGQRERAILYVARENAREQRQRVLATGRVRTIPYI